MDILELGIEKKRLNLLYNKGYYRAEDLLNIIPKDYLDYREPKSIKEAIVGNNQALLGVLKDIKVKGDRSLNTVAYFQDCNGQYFTVTWFQQAYISSSLYANKEYIICGELLANEYNGKIYYQINNPSFFGTDLEAFKKIIPVYPKIDGISSKYFLELVQKALEKITFEEIYPDWLLKQRKIISIQEKYRYLHSPKTLEEVNLAKRRIAFDDIFEFAFEIEEVNKLGNKNSAFQLNKREYVNQILESLPFTLTTGQSEAVENIFKKTLEGKRVNALVQGDVGAGKTIVAILMCFAGVNAGYQTCLMAPTGVLAKQHYDDMCKYAEPLGVKVAFLSGDIIDVNFEYDEKEILLMLIEDLWSRFEKDYKEKLEESYQIKIEDFKEKAFKDPLLLESFIKDFALEDEEKEFLLRLQAALEKKKKYRKTKKRNKDLFLYLIEKGIVNIVVGTHSVISKKIKFKNLAVTICDEEHRFGVLQRDALLEKAKEGVHHLSMTATPIPRSLALTIHGEGTDVFTIKTMPSGRKPVETKLLKKPDEAYALMEKEILKGRQCYVVCPLIEHSKSEKMKEIEDVTNVHLSLVKYFGPKGIKVGKITGDLDSDEIDKEISAFSNKEYDIIVSTTIIEVGVNVPNSTVITILNAERFGLAQLHQLRGRVGRGSFQSYCFLVSNFVNKRALVAMTQTTDGFKISEIDLEIRGSGEFLGLKQSGENKKLSLAILCPKTLAIVRDLLKEENLYEFFYNKYWGREKMKELDMINIQERLRLEELEKKASKKTKKSK